MRLQVVEALLRLHEERDEIGALVMASADRSSARMKVQEPPFSFSEPQADHIREYPLGRRTELARLSIIQLPLPPMDRRAQIEVSEKFAWRCTIRAVGHCVWVMAATDDGDFELFFRSELSSIVATVFRITGDVGVAEEITQEAFVRALTRWRRIRSYDRPGAWVRRVAIRDAVRVARRQQRPLPVMLAERLPAAEPQGIDEELWAAVGALPGKQRAAVVLYYLEDRPTIEVAELLGCAEATVRSQLRKARDRLAEVLNDDVEGEEGVVRDAHG